MEKLNKQNVYHVANLAKLNISESEVDKYQTQLNDILTEIEKIENVNIDGNIMISPSNNVNRFNEDDFEHIDKVEVMAKASKSNGDFIIVSRVLND